MPTYSLVHRTVNSYPAQARRSRNEIRQQPRQDSSQRLVEFQLDVSPSAELHREVDYFGNDVWLVAIEADHDELVISSTSIVDISQPQFTQLTRPWNMQELAREAALEFILPSPRVPRLDEIVGLIAEMDASAHSAEDLLKANSKIPELFTYEAGSTEVNTSLADVLVQRRGVCQDFAHVMLAVARELGWPARYVSGYLAPEDGKALGESHAWIEVSSPGGGWLGLDPTHGALVDDNFIAVAVGRDYDDAAPLKGTFMSTKPGDRPQVEVEVHLVDQ